MSSSSIHIRTKIGGLFLLCLLPVLGFSQSEKLKRFPLSSVLLLESPFRQAQQTDKAYILSLDPDRLLAPYLREAGLEAKEKGYGNWEGSGLDGHIGGHYLSALAKMYAATGHAELNRRLQYMINELDRCQQKGGDGYVGGVPGGKALWQEVAQGRINAGSFSLNKKWVPWYNLHKLYAGLVDAYVLTGNIKAKEILLNLSEWCWNLTASLSEEQMQQMLRSEHGGMNEVFANVAAITGEEKYLELARRFSHQRILNPLLQKKDSLTGLHANTQIPKVIGFLRVAEVGGREDWAQAAAFFWQTVVQNRTVSIGGNSVREHFHPSNNFTSMIEDREGPETCNTYNMLKLSGQLFLSHPQGKYMDYYERGLYNHILSSQHPQGGFVYFTPMRPRHYRVYSQPQLGFWCCVGSGMENHAQYGELIYAHNKRDIFVNLFVPSRLHWKEKGMTLTQQTSFPYEEKTELRVKMDRAQSFAFHIRYPVWVKEGALQVRVNGRNVAIQPNRDSYVTVERLWKTGDVVSISLPMETTVEGLPDGSPWVSFVHGPVVLAAATDTTGLSGLRADDSRMGHIARGALYPLEEAPLLVTDSKKGAAAAVKKVKGKPLTFTAAPIIYPDQYKSLQLEPFFQVHDARYMIYWPLTDKRGLAKRQDSIRVTEQERLVLETRTVDGVTPGEQQPESDHHFKGEGTESGVFRDRHWRDASGWFSYELRNREKKARLLRVTYYGKDKDRHFDIYINEVRFQTVKLDGSGGDRFVDIDFELPPAFVQSNAAETVTVKFAAHTGSRTGKVFALRLLK